MDVYAQHGYTVEITQQFETFAGGWLSPTLPNLSSPTRSNFAANWRALPPDQMDIGPVLDPRRRCRRQDVRASSPELAEEADAGFNRQVLADLFAMLERYPDRRFAFYGADADHLSAMRTRFAEWRQQLLDVHRERSSPPSQDS